MSDVKEGLRSAVNGTRSAASQPRLEAVASAALIVVGAGLGGLAAALHLARAGRKVLVVEKNQAVGGKAGVAEHAGYVFDTGPTLLTMPFVVRELFHDLGERLEDYLDLLPVEPLCRYFFSDGSILDISNSADRTLDQIRRFSPQDADGFLDFLERGRRIYELAARPFLYQGFGEWKARYLAENLKALTRFGGLDLFRTLDRSVSRSFHDPRLIQLFDRFATYNGSSPYRTPATFAMIPYVELTTGGWYVRGGMHRLAEALADCARRLGVIFQTGVACEEILTRRGRVAGVRLANGRVLESSVVVVNADALHACQHLLGNQNGRRSRFMRKRLATAELSSSGFILLIGVNKTYPHLKHHNIFFSSDYRREFEEIFSLHVPPEEPTIYLSVSSRSDPSMAPPGASNMFILVNVPALDDRLDWKREAARIRTRILERLRRFGLDDLEGHIEYEEVRTPCDFEDRYNAFRGSLYGFSSNRWSSAFLRPRNRSREIKGLYFAGGSTHPGGGIPLVLLSGKITAELVTGHEFA